MSPARKYRRDTYKKMGLLKAKNGWGRFSEKGIAWYNLKQEEGRDFHEKHMRMVNDQIEEQLGSKLNSLKETWKGLNYSEKEIEMLEESFTLTNIKDKETWREDRKRAKSLVKEANKSKKERLADARDKS
jgi:hypothetical protein